MRHESAAMKIAREKQYGVGDDLVTERVELTVDHKGLGHSPDSPPTPAAKCDFERELATAEK